MCKYIKCINVNVNMNVNVTAVSHELISNFLWYKLFRRLGFVLFKTVLEQYVDRLVTLKFCDKEIKFCDKELQTLTS